MRFAHLGFCSAAAALVACGGGTTTVSPAPHLLFHPLPGQSAEAITSAPKLRPSATHALLYVGGYRNNVVDVYDLSVHGYPLVETITDGVDGPGGLALDAQNTLYVANNNNGTVTAYPFGSTSPSLTLHDRLSFATDVAVARNGDVYVANRGSKPGIAVFKPGQNTVARYITSQLIAKPESIFFHRDTLYISDDNTGVSVRSRGGKIVSLGLQGLGAITSGLALDERNGALYVGDNSNNVIHVFPKGSVTAAYSLPIVSPNFIVVAEIRHHTSIVSADFQSQNAYFFKPSNPNWYGVFQTAAEEANGVAFQPAD
jgi:hypothetical protein